LRRIIATLLIGSSLALVGAPAADARPVPDPTGPAVRLRQSTLIWTDNSSGPPGQGVTARDAPEARIWGWCGIITKEMKVVRTFKKHGGAKVHLYCGGPKYSEKPRWGLRHIERYHESQWENKSFGTFQSWREIADISIAAVLADPVVKGPVKRGKRCYSRYVFLWDVSRDRMIDFMTVRVVFKATGDRRIITAYPADNCSYY
jgi:hypothetical protein